MRVYVCRPLHNIKIQMPIFCEIQHLSLYNATILGNNTYKSFKIGSVHT